MTYICLHYTRDYLLIHFEIKSLDKFDLTKDSFLSLVGCGCNSFSAVLRYHIPSLSLLYTLFPLSTKNGVIMIYKGTRIANSKLGES